jgi:hypothetical protein
MPRLSRWAKDAFGGANCNSNGVGRLRRNKASREERADGEMEGADENVFFDYHEGEIFWQLTFNREKKCPGRQKYKHPKMAGPLAGPEL